MTGYSTPRQSITGPAESWATVNKNGDWQCKACGAWALMFTVLSDPMNHKPDCPLRNSILDLKEYAAESAAAGRRVK